MADLIDRQAAYEVLSGYYHHRTERQHESLREALGRVPSAQPERKTARWKGEGMGDCRCSLCGVVGKGWMNFCFNCGAKMEVVNDER